jgi:hypothetical protein
MDLLIIEIIELGKLHEIFLIECVSFPLSFNAKCL